VGRRADQEKRRDEKQGGGAQGSDRFFFVEFDTPGYLGIRLNPQVDGCRLV
jgi:hypothetical protein